MKRSMVFILFFISAPILLSARVIQQLYMIDPATGFYLDGFAGIGTAISALCFALIAVTLALVWLSNPQTPTVPRKSPLLGGGAFVAALSIAVSSVGKLLIKDKGSLYVGLFGILAAAALAYFGLTCFTGGKFNPISTVLPICYACLKLVLDFINYTGEVTVTDSVFNIVTMCLVLLFFYSSGKIFAGVAGKRTHILFFSYGLCAAFFCADSAFVRIILSLTHSNVALHGSGTLEIAYIGIAVFVVAAVWTLSDPSNAAKNAELETDTDITNSNE